MSFDFELKVGDSVRSFNDFVGTVTHLEYFQGVLSSVTVRWMTGQLMTHPCTAEDIWLEGQPAKEHPDVKAHKWFVAHQEEIHIRNLALQEAYKIAIKKAVDAKENIKWAVEPCNDEATLEMLADGIKDWSQIVKGLDGNDKDDLIKCDLFTREWLHGLINGLKKQEAVIPDALLDMLAEADQYFIDRSIALPPPDLKKQNGLTQEQSLRVEDMHAFWYQYRWPICLKR